MNLHPRSVSTYPLPRRRFMLGGACTVLLAACGGGGGSSQSGGAGGGPPSAATPSGRLIYCNSSEVAVLDFARQQTTTWPLGDTPAMSRGMSVSPQGLVALAREIDNDFIGLETYTLDGARQQGYRIARSLAFFTSPVMFDAQGARIAFSVNELPDPDGERQDRVLVYSWPDGRPLAVLDGFENPEWIAGSGELVARHAQSENLHRFSTDLVDQGTLGGLTVLSFNASFSVSADGRYVVMEDGTRILAHDLQTGASWVAVQRVSNVHGPRLSPDGRWLAFHAVDTGTAIPTFHTYVPHIVRFAAGQTVPVDDAALVMDGALVFTTGTMAWLP